MTNFSTTLLSSSRLPLSLCNVTRAASKLTPAFTSIHGVRRSTKSLDSCSKEKDKDEQGGKEEEVFRKAQRKFCSYHNKSRQKHLLVSQHWVLKVTFVGAYRSALDRVQRSTASFHRSNTVANV